MFSSVLVRSSRAAKVTQRLTRSRLKSKARVAAACTSGCAQQRRDLATAQPAILDRSMGESQWYIHLSREDRAKADKGVIAKAIYGLRNDCKKHNIKLVVGFGPSLLKDITKDLPDDFQEYVTYKAPDGSGKEAKGTQEELLFWLAGPHKDAVWKCQHNARRVLEGTMKVARETPTFMTPSFGWDDMTEFIDGTGNPEVERDREVAIVPEGKPGAGGSFIIAQRWVHHLGPFWKLPLADQENVFGRTKADSTRLEKQLPTSHLSHVELRQGKTGDATKPKRDEMTRRSTPYAFHDGTVGLYFMGFCARQAPLRERIQAMYGIGVDGNVRDALTDYSTPASGSYYFAPSVEVLDSL